MGSNLFLEDDSEDDSDVDLPEDLPDEMPNGENLGRYNPTNFLRQATNNLSTVARNAAASVMRRHGRLPRLTGNEAQDIEIQAEMIEVLRNRIGNRNEDERIFQNRADSFRRALAIVEGSL